MTVTKKPIAKSNEPKEGVPNQRATAVAPVEQQTKPVYLLVDYRSYVKSPGKLESIAKRVKNNMATNAYFKGEAVDALRLQLDASFTTFETSWEISSTTQSVQNQATTEVAAKNLISVLNDMRDYVIANCENDVNIAQSSGFTPRASSQTRRKPTVLDGLDFDIELKTRKVFLHCKSQGKGFSYVSFFQEEGTKEWKQCGISTKSRNIPVDGLTKGKNYFLSAAAMVANEVGPLVEPGILWTGV